MFNSFLELVYEADLNTSEHPEFHDLARELCNEEPDTRAAAIQELRDMIYERGECAPRRMDDEFLLRFLRARRSRVSRSHSLLVRYCNFLEKYPGLYKDVDLWGLVKLDCPYDACFSDRPGIGRITIVRFGLWNPADYPAEDMVRVALAALEIGMRVPRLQALGGTMIIDLEGLTATHVASLTPTVAYQIACLLGLAIPCKMNSCHLINYNWLLSTIFLIFRRLISKRTWKRIHFHGSDLGSLRQHIDPDCLPPRYGGTCRLHATFSTWLDSLKKYRDEAFDREMKEYGWLIKE